jgi:hypothetical protein
MVRNFMVAYSKNHSDMCATPILTKVIFNDPATIVFWSDGTKTVVKCSEDDIYDPEKGLAMAFSKKMFGNQGNYYNHFKKWLPEEVDTDSAYPSLTVDMGNLGHAATTAFLQMCAARSSRKAGLEK